MVTPGAGRPLPFSDATITVCVGFLYNDIKTDRHENSMRRLRVGDTGCRVLVCGFEPVTLRDHGVFISKLETRCPARNLQLEEGFSGSHGQRATEEKGIHLDLQQYFNRNSGEDQKKN